MNGIGPKDITPDLADAKRWSFGLYLLIFALYAACLIAFDFSDGLAFNADVDDDLRAIGVRVLLETGNWYDTTIPAVRMPEAYVSHWSRLVDLPYALIATVFQTAMPTG